MNEQLLEMYSRLDSIQEELDAQMIMQDYDECDELFRKMEKIQEQIEQIQQQIEERK